MIRIAVAVVALAGCSIGAGSAYVGQWRPREEIAAEVCRVEDAPPGTVIDAPLASGEPRCRETKRVVHEVPGRRYWGAILAFPALGAARVGYRGDTTTEVRVEPSFELLRGRGRWAYGVRASAVLDGRTQDDGEAGIAGALAITGVGHLSLTEELGVYGGVGYTPYAAVLGERTALGARALAGVQLALQKTQGETFILINLELDRMYLELDDRYRSTGFTGNFGLFF